MARNFSIVGMELAKLAKVSQALLYELHAGVNDEAADARIMALRGKAVPCGRLPPRCIPTADLPVHHHRST